MAETTTETNGKNEIKQPENPIILPVTRVSDGKEATIKLLEGRTTKGRDSGKMVFEPVLETDEDKDALIAFYGRDNIINILKKDARATSLEILNVDTGVEGVIDPDTGKFNQELFASNFANLEVAGVSIGELRDSLAEYSRKLVSLNPATQLEEFLAAANKIKEYQVQIDKKRKPKNVEAATAVAA